MDLENRELRKRGLRVKLQHKPFQVLELLVRFPGQLVTRTELAKHLWPELHVDFERSLNTAVNALRQALGDSPQVCRFIETRPGLGYAFIAAVEEVADEPAARVKLRRGHTGAHPDYLRGRYFYNKLTEDDLHKCVACYEAALADDPECALAYAGLAEAYGLFASLNMTPAMEIYPRAREAARSALMIDAALGEAHAAQAGVRMLFEQDWAGAEAGYRRALELSPDSAVVCEQYGAYLAAMGKSEQAQREFRHAQESDAALPAAGARLAWCLYMGRDFRGASEQCWKALVMDPRFAAAQHILGLAYEKLGMIEDAMVELRNARTCSRDHPVMLAAFAHACATAGETAQAAEILQELRQISMRRYVSPYCYGIVYAGLGDNERAMESIEQACRERDVWTSWLKVEPRFDGLRAESRFQKLLRSVGLDSTS